MVSISPCHPAPIATAVDNTQFLWPHGEFCFVCQLISSRL